MGTWLRLVGCVLGRAYHAFLLTLLLAALVPALWSWSSYVVRSGSMEPVIAVGDVVIAAPFGPDEKVPLGRVVVFRDPGRPGEDRLLVHRVVGDLGGDEYATAGDANASNDIEPITSTDVVARARILVPFVGKPLVWLQGGDWGKLLFWALVSLLAGFAAVRSHRRPTEPPDAHADDSADTGARNRAAATPALTMLVAALLGVIGTQSATAAFTARTANAGSSWTVDTWPVLDYTGQVLADSPYVYYQVDEASGTSSAADSSGNGRTGTYTSIGAYRQADALPNNAGYAVRFDGTSDRLVSSGQVSNPTTFSLETWFKTTTTQGGKLIGFESTRSATSSSYDRHVFMRANGRVVYGGWSVSGNPTLRITSPAAYNDGQWHHLVLTARPASGQQQTSTLYVDGQPVVSGTTTRTSSYSGYWRVGYGGWSDLDFVGSEYPSSSNISATIDQVAVYHSELSAGRVAAHWAAR